jgi:hypothetical protein
MLYLNANRDKIKSDNPGIAVTEIAKKGGEMWRDLKDKSVCLLIRKLGDTEEGCANKEGLRDHEMYCLLSCVCVSGGGLWNNFTAFSRHDLPHSKKFTGTKKF